VDTWDAFLSETAGAGYGLIRKSQHRRVKDRGNELDCPSVLTSMARMSASSSRGAGCNPRRFPQEAANRRELLDRAAKSELVTALGQVFKTTQVVVVAHYSGLTVAQMQTLRRQMKQAGANVKVAKNRLAKIALEGSDVASIAPLLKGPALIAFSGDPVAAPKVAVDFAKTNERFVILGGAMGKTTLDPNGVKALAALPSLDELRAKIVGLIQAPATKIAQVVNAPAAKVARVVAAYAAKSESAAA
jgi:large subunit ribosomal protein L10